MMIYIYGQEKYLMQNKINDYKKSNHNEFININSLHSYEDIINNILGINLFDENKLIIIKDHDIFKNDDLGKKLIYDLNKIDISHKKIIFVSSNDKKNNNVFIKYLKKNAENYYFPELKQKEVFKYIKKYLDQEKIIISYLDIEYLLSKMPPSLDLIINEINKITKNHQKIDTKIIDDNIFEFNVKDNFGFVNAILEKNQTMVFIKYQEKIKQNLPISFIIAEIAKLLSDAFDISQLSNQYQHIKEIVNITKMNAFRIKKLLELKFKFGEKKLQKMLLSLSKIDQEIKSGKINGKISFEYFLVNLFKT